MKKHIGKLFSKIEGGRNSKAQRARRLQVESLECRRLLAADLNPNHNNLIAEDVNMDFMVTPMDALLVINALNQGRAGSLAEGETGARPSSLIDVNGDGILSPMDALTIINRLNLAEGEDPVPTFVQYSYQITNTADAPISGNTVAVGDTFRIHVFAQDVRPDSFRSLTDRNDPDFGLFNGISAVAQDLGVSDLSVVSYVRPTSFFSGITFDPEFFNARDVTQGGGIQVNGVASPIVSDGQFFSITTSSGSKTFEFDIAGSAAVTSGRVAIPLPTIVQYSGMISSMITAIQGAGLGLTPVDRGFQLIGLPVEQFTFDPGNSSLTLSTPGQEYLNEVKAFVERFRSVNPVGPVAFYSVDFKATATGSVVFTPNQADRPGSETNIFGSPIPIPGNMIDYGAPITIRVIADPTAPKAINDTLSSPEDVALVIAANATANDTVTTGRTLTIDSVSAIAGVTKGTVSGTTYTPPANFFGTDTITYVVRDNTGLKSGVATITINVTPVNDAPVAKNDAFTVDEGSTANSLNLLADNGSGVDTAGPLEPADTITITRVGPANGGGTTFTTANGGKVTIESGGKTVNYVPGATFVGTDTFVYTITDSGGLTATATVTVEVAPGVLPRARRDTATGLEDGSVMVSVLDNDSANPGATKLLKSFTNGARGTVTRKSSDIVSPDYNVLVYTPQANFYGTDTFTYVMNDSAALGADSIATVTVTVTDVNDPPLLTTETLAATEDTALTIPIATLLSNDSPGIQEAVNVPVQTLKITSVAVVPASAAGGTVAIVGTNVVYTPAANFNGQYLFTYVAQDSGTPALSATATVTVNVAAVNDNPLANPDTVAGTEDTLLSIPAATLLSNDAPGPATATDEASQTLSITGVSAASGKNGTVSFSAGVISYRPAANFNGADTFTYTISDGAGGTATGTVTVNVAAVNDAPVAVADSISGFRDLPITVSSATLLANDTRGGGNDENTQTLTITAVAANSNTHGTVVLASDGIVTYTPEAGFSGAASFNYTLRDSGGATATGIVNVTVKEFLPRAIEGTIYTDDNDNGQIDSTERKLGGLAVVLTGVAPDGSSLPSQTQHTLSDGSYSFKGLGPGTYTVSFSPPNFLKDTAAPNSHSGLLVNTEAGDTIGGQNFSVGRGVDLSNVVDGAAYAVIIDNFASSRRPVTGPATQATDVQNVVGAYFALGADNSMLWSALAPIQLGSESGQVQYSELVLAKASAGNSLAYLTVVDTNHQVTTRTLSESLGEFFVIEDRQGALLVGIRKVPQAFQNVDRAAPPFSVNKYLDSVDQVFAEHGWDIV